MELDTKFISAPGNKQTLFPSLLEMVCLWHTGGSLYWMGDSDSRHVPNRASNSDPTYFPLQHHSISRNETNQHASWSCTHESYTHVFDKHVSNTRTNPLGRHVQSSKSHKQTHNVSDRPSKSRCSASCLLNPLFSQDIFGAVKRITFSKGKANWQTHWMIFSPLFSCSY